MGIRMREGERGRRGRRSENGEGRNRKGTGE